MTSNNSRFKEQRSFPRFPASDDSAIMLSSANVISYSVLNISKAGLAFCYYGSIETSVQRPITTTMILFSNDFGVTELPVEVISDTELTIKDLQMFELGASVRRHSLRKCGVKFLPMNEEQEKTVDAYLRDCNGSTH